MNYSQVGEEESVDSPRLHHSEDLSKNLINETVLSPKSHQVAVPKVSPRNKILRSEFHYKSSYIGDIHKQAACSQKFQNDPISSDFYSQESHRKKQDAQEYFGTPLEANNFTEAYSEGTHRQKPCDISSPGTFRQEVYSHQPCSEEAIYKKTPQLESFFQQIPHQESAHKEVFYQKTSSPHVFQQQTEGHDSVKNQSPHLTSYQQMTPRVQFYHQSEEYQNHPTSEASLQEPAYQNFNDQETPDKSEQNKVYYTNPLHIVSAANQNELNTLIQETSFQQKASNEGENLVNDEVTEDVKRSTDNILSRPSNISAAKLTEYRNLPQLNTDLNEPTFGSLVSSSTQEVNHVQEQPEIYSQRALNDASVNEFRQAKPPSDNIVISPADLNHKDNNYLLNKPKLHESDDESSLQTPKLYSKKPSDQLDLQKLQPSEKTAFFHDKRVSTFVRGDFSMEQSPSQQEKSGYFVTDNPNSSRINFGAHHLEHVKQSISPRENAVTKNLYPQKSVYNSYENNDNNLASPQSPFSRQIEYVEENRATYRDNVKSPLRKTISPRETVYYEERSISPRQSPLRKTISPIKLGHFQDEIQYSNQYIVSPKNFSNASLLKKISPRELTNFEGEYVSQESNTESIPHSYRSSQKVVSPKQLTQIDENIEYAKQYIVSPRKEIKSPLRNTISPRGSNYAEEYVNQQRISPRNNIKTFLNHTISPRETIYVKEQMDYVEQKPDTASPRRSQKNVSLREAANYDEVQENEDHKSRVIYSQDTESPPQSFRSLQKAISPRQYTHSGEYIEQDFRSPRKDDNAPLRKTISPRDSNYFAKEIESTEHDQQSISPRNSTRSLLRKTISPRGSNYFEKEIEYVEGDQHSASPRTNIKSPLRSTISPQKLNYDEEREEYLERTRKSPQEIFKSPLQKKISPASNNQYVDDDVEYVDQVALSPKKPIANREITYLEEESNYLDPKQAVVFPRKDFLKSVQHNMSTMETAYFDDTTEYKEQNGVSPQIDYTLHSTISPLRKTISPRESNNTEKEIKYIEQDSQSPRTSTKSQLRKTISPRDIIYYEEEVTSTPRSQRSVVKKTISPRTVIHTKHSSENYQKSPSSQGNYEQNYPNNLSYEAGLETSDPEQHNLYNFSSTQSEIQQVFEHPKKNDYFQREVDHSQVAKNITSAHMSNDEDLSTPRKNYQNQSPHTDSFREVIEHYPEKYYDQNKSLSLRSITSHKSVIIDRGKESEPLKQNYSKEGNLLNGHPGDEKKVFVNQSSFRSFANPNVASDRSKACSDQTFSSYTEQETISQSNYPAVQENAEQSFTTKDEKPVQKSVPINHGNSDLSVDQHGMTIKKNDSEMRSVSQGSYSMVDIQADEPKDYESIKTFQNPEDEASIIKPLEKGIKSKSKTKKTFFRMLGGKKKSSEPHDTQNPTLKATDYQKSKSTLKDLKVTKSGEHPEISVRLDSQNADTDEQYPRNSDGISIHSDNFSFPDFSESASMVEKKKKKNMIAKIFKGSKKKSQAQSMISVPSFNSIPEPEKTELKYVIEAKDHTISRLKQARYEDHQNFESKLKKLQEDQNSIIEYQKTQMDMKDQEIDKKAEKIKSLELQIKQLKEAKHEPELPSLNSETKTKQFARLYEKINLLQAENRNFKNEIESKKNLEDVLDEKLKITNILNASLVECEAKIVKLNEELLELQKKNSFLTDNSTKANAELQLAHEENLALKTTLTQINKKLEKPQITLLGSPRSTENLHKLSEENSEIDYDQESSSKQKASKSFKQKITSKTKNLFLIDNKNKKSKHAESQVHLNKSLLQLICYIKNSKSALHSQSHNVLYIPSSIESPNTKIFSYKKEEKDITSEIIKDISEVIKNECKKHSNDTRIELLNLNNAVSNIQSSIAESLANFASNQLEKNSSSKLTTKSSNLFKKASNIILSKGSTCLSKNSQESINSGKVLSSNWVPEFGNHSKYLESHIKTFALTKETIIYILLGDCSEKNGVIQCLLRLILFAKNLYLAVVKDYPEFEATFSSLCPNSTKGKSTSYWTKAENFIMDYEKIVSERALYKSSYEKLKKGHTQNAINPVNEQKPLLTKKAFFANQKPEQKTSIIPTNHYIENNKQDKVNYSQIYPLPRLNTANAMYIPSFPGELRFFLPSNLKSSHVYSKSCF